LGRSCLLTRYGRKDGTIEVMEKRGRRCKQLLDHLKEMRRCWKIERGSTRCHSVENSLWKRLWS
jgi:hypothetical protein